MRISDWSSDVCSSDPADPVPEERALAMKLGATDVVDALADDAAKQIVEMTRGGVDHAIEAVGRPASASLAVASLRRGGTATILGMMPLAEQVGLGAMDLPSGQKFPWAFMGGTRFPVQHTRSRAANGTTSGREKR